MNTPRENNRPNLRHNRPVVVLKLGSSALVDESGLIKEDVIAKIARLIKEGDFYVLVVSSGAVASGMLDFFSPEILELREQLPSKRKQFKRSLASVGQVKLMTRYYHHFREAGLIPAQILITSKDLADKKAYDKIINTISDLLENEVVPIVNENDTLAMEGFGDNDMLSCLLAGILHAQMLILCTDIDGIFTDNPKTSTSAVKIPIVSEVNERELNLEAATDEPSGSSLERNRTGKGSIQSVFGTGGMKSKVKGALRARSLGTSVYIGTLTAMKSIAAIVNGQGSGTYFTPSENPRRRRHLQWVAFHAPPCGDLIVDKGAAIALEEKKSLLIKGVSEIKGNFGKGDVINILNTDLQILGRGTAEHGSDALIANRSQFGIIAVHRDNLYLY